MVDFESDEWISHRFRNLSCLKDVSSEICQKYGRLSTVFAKCINKCMNFIVPGCL